jgi:hypothetical protein
MYTLRRTIFPNSDHWTFKRVLVGKRTRAES